MLSLYHVFIFIIIVGGVAFFIKPNKKVINTKLSKIEKIERNQIRSKYNNWMNTGFIIWLVSGMPLFIYILSNVIMIAISNMQIAHFHDTVFFLREGALGLLPSLFFAIFSGVIFLELLFRIKLNKKEAYIFSRYKAQEKGITFNRVFYTIIFPLYICMMILSLDSYARVTENKFIINRYLGFTEKKYSFKEIKDIEVVYFLRRHSSMREKAYLIRFNNGDTYDFSEVNHYIGLAKQEEVIEYIKAHMK